MNGSLPESSAVVNGVNYKVWAVDMDGADHTLAFTDGGSNSQTTSITANRDYYLCLTSTEVTEITDKYKDKFGIPVGSELKEELWAYIGKIANVSRIKTLTLTYRTEKGQVLGESEVDSLDSGTSYFEFSNYITTEIL